MIYGSVCSGIEAATAAWHPLGWQPAFFSEIDEAPRTVLKHHYPDVKLFGDFQKITRKDIRHAGSIDILVGGTPCQDFSVAGLRKGLAGKRGNLTIEFLRLAERLRPQWLVWENVPGIMSIDKGKAFGAFLGGLAECGYGFAYRVFDAQYFGVPQRRRRVFVIGYLGDWRPSAAVLFERHSLRGDPAPGRAQGQDAPAGIREGVAGTIGAHKTGGWGAGGDLDTCGAIIPETAHTLRGEGFDASEDGSGRGIPLIAGCLQERDAKGADSDTKPGHLIPFDCKASGGRGFSTRGDQSPTLRSMTGKKANSGGHVAISNAMAVRRLTPRECERLMGFPDDYTLVPFGKRMMADGPRYRMLGNSMAVPVMHKIGRRIDLVRKLMGEK